MKTISLFLFLLLILVLLSGCKPCGVSEEITKYINNESITIEKYSTKLKKSPFYLHILVVRIDTCEYVIIKEVGGSKSQIIHKADCANPIHSDKKW